MAGSVTVKDIAQAASVSVGTVSRVINNQSGVNEDKRQHVMQVATSLGYITSGKQNFNSRENSKQLKEIGFFYRSLLDNFLDDNSVVVEPYWSHVLHGAELEARHLNLKFNYRVFNEQIKSERHLLNMIQGMHLDGILLVGPAEAEFVNILASTKIPLVLVENHVPGVPIDTVSSDILDGAKQAVSYLLEQGHQQIAFLCGPVKNPQGNSRIISKIYSGDQRIQGFYLAMLDHGQSVDKNLFEATDFTINGGYEACKRLLEKNVKFSAIFCISDLVAIGAMKALNEAGLNVPNDVSIVGFADIDMAEHVTPALTTVRVHKEMMGISAVKALISRSLDPGAPNINISLGSELIKRNSVNKLHQDK